MTSLVWVILYLTLLLPSSSTDDVGCVSVESVDPYPQRRSFYYKNPGEVVGAVMKSDGKTEGKFRRKGRGQLGRGSEPS